MLFLLSNPRDIPVDDLVSEEDVVVVTLSYRVNAFGFFSYEDQLMPGIFGFLLTLKKIIWFFLWPLEICFVIDIDYTITQVIWD